MDLEDFAQTHTNILQAVLQRCQEAKLHVLGVDTLPSRDSFDRKEHEFEIVLRIAVPVTYPAAVSNPPA